MSDLETLIREALKQYRELPRWRHLELEREQRISWLQSRIPAITKEELVKIVDEHDRARP